MYGPPTIPALGGGLLAVGAVTLGHYFGLIWGLSLIVLAVIIFGVFKLIRGQHKAKIQQG